MAAFRIRWLEHMQDQDPVMCYEDSETEEIGQDCRLPDQDGWKLGLVDLTKVTWLDPELLVPRISGGIRAAIGYRDLLLIRDRTS